MMNSSYTFSDSVIDLKADKFWLSSVSNIDSVIELSLGDSSIKVYSQNSKKWDGLLEEMYSTNIGKQVLIADYNSERTNPYFQRGHYACWGLGSDDYLDHDPILVWAYFGWIEVFSWDDLMRFKYRFVDPKPGPSPENECFFC